MYVHLLLFISRKYAIICTKSQTIMRKYVRLRQSRQKLTPMPFAVVVNQLVNNWRLRAKFVDDLTIMKVIPRNSPIMRHIVSDVQEFASNNNMQPNPVKCKEMRVNFLHYNSCELQPIVTGGNRRLYAIRQLGKWGVPQGDLVSIYFSPVRSILEYACVVFANLSKYLSQDLERI